MQEVNTAVYTAEISSGGNVATQRCHYSAHLLKTALGINLTEEMFKFMIRFELMPALRNSSAYIFKLNHSLPHLFQTWGICSAFLTELNILELCSPETHA